MQAALFTSNDQTWCTPENVLERVRRVGPIVLDPCSGSGSIVQAETTYDGPPGIDGLQENWDRGGIVFVNCPYGRAIGDWVSKCAIEHLEREVEIILLVPARTDTRWWHEAVVGVASSICFWRGRLTFLGAPAGAPFPSAVIYYGQQKEKFRNAFSDVGWIV
jgi:site-specific DNA-methyltransferase (adenine-specific)